MVGPMRVSIVLPAHDEEANIRESIEAATRTAERLLAEHEIVVVDDGSRDRTAAIVREIADRDPRVRLVRHDRNRGYGEALRSGFLAARLDYIFLTDADLQFDMDEMEKLLPYVGTVDVIAGYRVNRQDPLVRKVCAWGWNLIVRVFFWVPVRDIDCAFKLFERRLLDDIRIGSVGNMVSTELMVRVGRRGASVVEVPVTHLPRRAGRSQGATPRVIARALIELVRMRRELSALDGLPR